MNNTNVSFICTLFDFFIYFVIMTNLMDKKKTTLRRTPFFLIFFLSQTISFYFTNIHSNPLYSFIVEFSALMVTLYFYLKPSIIEFLTSISITYFYLFITQMLFALVVSLSGLNPASEIASILACNITLLVAILISYLFDLRKLTSLFCESHKIGAIILISLFSFALSLSFYFKINVDSFISSIIFLLISVIIIIMIVLISANQLITITQNTKRIDAYEQYIPMLNELILNVRKRQHNHINEIQAIIGLMHTHKDYDSLTKAMSETLDNFAQEHEPEYLLKLNMLLVSGFLYQKQCYAHKIGRGINYIFNSYNLHSAVPEYILIEMFGILIDNSLEAIPTGENITISVDTKDEKIIFITRNSGHILSDEDYANFFSSGYSLKSQFAPNKEYSGLGLSRLRELVISKYNGKITLWNEGTDILFQIEV